MRVIPKSYLTFAGKLLRLLSAPSKHCRYPPVGNQKEFQMNDINPGVDLSILDKANEAQDAYITNPNMKTADAYIQALQETTMTLIASVLMDDWTVTISSH